MRRKIRVDYMSFLLGFVIFARLTQAQTDFWQPMNVPFGSAVNALAVNSKDWLFAGTAHEGILRSTDMGSTWIQLNTGQGVSTVNALVVTRHGCMLAGTDSGVWRSLDDGNSWSNASKGLTNLAIRSLASNTEGYIFAGTWDGGFRSTDTGENWTSLGIGAYPMAVTCFAFSSRGDIFAGTFEYDICGHLYRSTNGGNDWSRLPIPCVQSLYIDSSDTPFAGLGDMECDFGFIARLTANGEGWTGIPIGPFKTSVNSIVMGPGQNLFAGTCSRGVFRSTDEGASFIQINTGLSDSTVNCLVVNSMGYIFAGTESGTVFRSVQPVTAIEIHNKGTPIRFRLGQNFPNPFNPTTTIKYELPKASNVTLKIFNTLGQEVATLVDEAQEPGHKSVLWDASGVASGVYIYKLEAGDYVSVKKMLLLR